MKRVLRPKKRPIFVAISGILMLQVVVFEILHAIEIEKHGLTLLGNNLFNFGISLWFLYFIVLIIAAIRRERFAYVVWIGLFFPLAIALAIEIYLYGFDRIIVIS